MLILYICINKVKVLPVHVFELISGYFYVLYEYIKETEHLKKMGLLNCIFNFVARKLSHLNFR